MADPGGELEDLEALEEALTAPWLQGLRLQGDTARRIYARRPLTADSVRVVKLATRGLEPLEAEALLADVEPCLARHDSCGVVALLEWIGKGEPRPLYIRLLHGLVQTAPLTLGRYSPCASPSPDIASWRASSPLSNAVGTVVDCRSVTPAGSTGATVHHKVLPQRHSRASVEAVEFLLSACPRLARSTLPLEQLGLRATSSTDPGNLAATSPEASPSSAAAQGRLLPLQTLCLRCDTPDPHTALIARALLRRSPEARDLPLPRALRRNARGHNYNLFVCNALTCLRQKRLAAEEAGEDGALLKEMHEIFLASLPTGSPSQPSPPAEAPASLGYPNSHGHAGNGRELGATPPPRAPRNPPPPGRGSPRRANHVNHLRHTVPLHGGAHSARGERDAGRHCESPTMPPPRALCQVLALRAARGLPPLGGTPRLGTNLDIQGCRAGGRHLPAIRAQ